ncbi:M3 family metallopeptidase (plasmid) [Deinococcus taeanensis]|uniref:M3 family metallopeptidase n=1 Tax=Deinococcus taeanensis TaxID=2737050 RepID=UPI001CDB7FFB|nr:M3 family metallopeptidase [Deinococcus taeanensis]UBV44565.1 M3 family metallopeptidase [Deinococcus taeanensis]
MSTAIQNLDGRAQAIVDAQQALVSLQPGQDDLPTWFQSWNRLKLKIQNLWLEQIVAQHTQPDQEETEVLHRRFSEHWLPQMERLDGALQQQALDSGLAGLHPAVAAALAEEPEASPRLLELRTQERQLFKDYQNIVSQQQVEYAGEHLTVAAAEARLRTTLERSEREALWRRIKAAELACAPALDALFGRLLQVRRDIAVESGHPNYASLNWADRADTIASTETLLEAIGEVFEGVERGLQQHRAEALGVQTLRPWDLDVALTSPTTFQLPIEEYVPTAERVLNRLDVQFGDVVRQIRDHGGFDLAPRPGKPNGNICAHYMDEGRSVLICNFSGGVESFRGLLHELGHASHHHSISSVPDHVFWDFTGFWEVQEFYAFVFTYIGLLELFELHAVSDDERRWYLRSTVERIMERFSDVEERTRLELWLYQQEPPTTDEIGAEYRRLTRTAEVDWTGLDEILDKRWQKPHTFKYAFYNIDYAIAMLAALQFVHAYQQDKSAALRRLKCSMLLGATVGAKRIFAEAGITYPFQRAQLEIARSVLEGWLS